MARIEFHRKSRRKRLRMFKERARKSVKSLAVGFYEKVGVRVEPQKLDSTVDEIIEHIIASVRNPKFVSEDQYPNVRDERTLLKKMADDIEATGLNDEKLELVYARLVKENEKRDVKRRRKVAKVSQTA